MITNTFDLEELVLEAREALKCGEYANARDSYNLIRQKAAPRSHAYEEALHYLRHLGGSDEAPEFRLLLELQGASTEGERVALIHQALEQGLEMDLYGEPLEQRLEMLELEARERADQEAEALLEQADQQLKPDDALHLVRRAADIAGTSDELRSEIEGRLRRLEDLAQAGEILRGVRSILDRPQLTIEDYDTVQRQAQQALELAPDDAGMAQLKDEVETLWERSRELLEMLSEAEEQLGTVPARARTTFSSVKEAAAAMSLVELAETAESGVRRAARALSDRIEEARILVRKGDEAQGRGDLDEARDLFAAAVALAGKETDAESRLSRIDRKLSAEERIRSLRAEAETAQGNFSYQFALDRLREARDLATSEHPDLVDHLEAEMERIEDARAEAQEIRTTIKLQRLPYTTPGELDEARAEILNVLGADDWEKIEQLFRGQAVDKLRAHANRAWLLVDGGQLDAALDLLRDAYQQWDDYLQGQGLVGEDIPSLRNRLQIVKAQLDDVETAVEAYADLHPKLSKAEESAEGDRYADALEAYTCILDELPALPENVRYVLGERLDRPGDGTVSGVLRNVRSGFVTAARRYARTQDRTLEMWQQRAEAAYRLGTPESLEEAGTLLEAQAIPLAQRLREYRDRSEQLGTDVLVEWTTADRRGDLQSLLDHIQRALRVQYLMQHGQELLNAGDYVGAQDDFKEILTLDAEYAQATSWLERVERFRELCQKLKEAEFRKDVMTQDALSREILECLPRSSWVQNYRTEHNLERRVRQYERAQRDLSRAERMVENGNFEAARPLVEKILQELPEDPRALRLRDTVEEGKDYLERLRALRSQAQDAFRTGDFQTAVDTARTILEERQNDREATYLEERAALAVRLEDEAAEALLLHEYEDAERLLQRVRNIAGVESVSARHVRWLDEIETELSAQSEMEELLSQMEEARRERDWVSAIRLAHQVLKQDGGRLQARKVSREGQRELFRDVESAIKDRSPDALQRVATALQTLERYYPGDSRVQDLREGHSRVTDLIHAQSTLARPFLDEETLESLVQQLDKLCEKWDDPAAHSTRNDVCYQLLLHRADRLERLDLSRAADLLGDALKIHYDKLIEDRHRDLRLQAALSAADRLLLGGEPDQARDLLYAFDGDKRVEDRLRRIQLCESKMQEVRELLERGDNGIPQAMTTLQALLVDVANFQPAIDVRKDIIENLRVRGRDEEDLWEAKRVLELLEGVAPDEAKQTRLTEISHKLRREKVSLSNEVRRAVEAPGNLTIADCQRLIDLISGVPSQERDTAMRDGLRDLQRYQNLIEVVSGHEATAKTLLDEAYGDKNKYARAEQQLELAIANECSIFATRESLRELRDRLIKQRAQHDEVERKRGSYELALQRTSGAVPLSSTSRKQIQTMIHELKSDVDQALRAGDEIRALDPQNRYQTRNWFDKNKADPLLEERRQLEAYRTNIEAIGEALLNGIAGWEEAQERKVQAEAASELHKDDRDYERAIRLWKETERLCESAIEQLSRAVDTPFLTPRAESLSGAAREMRSDVEGLRSESLQQAQHFRDELNRLQQGYKEAQVAFNDAHSCASLRTAREAYEEILAQNPLYEPAIKGRRHCEEEMEEACRNRSWWPYPVGVALLVALGFLLFHAIVDPESTPQPTATSTQALRTPTPTAVVLSTANEVEQETVAPQASPAPSTEPEVTPGAVMPPVRTCQIFNAGNAWARSEPTTGATGTLLRRGTELTVVDFVDRPDGKWYRIEEPVDGWVRAVEVACPDE